MTASSYAVKFSIWVRPLPLDWQLARMPILICRVFLEYGFTGMVFSSCGRYVYGTSSWYDAVVEIVDTWDIEPTRTLRIPQAFRQASSLSISLWGGYIMLVGNMGSVIATAPIRVSERASFSIALLAVAPSLVESATGFRVLGLMMSRAKG